MRAIFVDLPFGISFVDHFAIRENGIFITENGSEPIQKIAIIEGYDGALALANDLVERHDSGVEIFMKIKTL